ncbi:cytochrome P450 [Phyllobacterium phragmitis]|uniref:Cytochrome P450 n=1 Tax=Phyllobacterium phragmitis TaxID=2670329 RepID=A0A2S9IJE3_9HYPH|nr:cytochrome P450 [Phyllobacterium phragmitis]PRD40629.1 cytochrome P450 [Phyllobacterium phragmitis]
MDILTTPDLTSEAFFANRYPTYRVLRDNFPFFQTEIEGEPCIVLTRYAHVDEALRNPLVTMRPEPGKLPQEFLGNSPGARFYRESAATMDAPDHTKVRRILSPAFTSRAIGKMRAWMDETIERLLKRLEGETEVEFVSEFSGPLAAEVSCKLAHVPVEEAGELISKAHDMITLLGASKRRPGVLETADATGQLYYALVEDVLDRMKGKELPEDDTLAVLLAAEGREDGLTRSGLATLLMGYLIAAYHTTQSAITNATLALLRHPDQKARLIAQPELARSAWEEIIRYDGPVHFRHRYASAPTTIGGKPIEAGQRLLLGLQPANRDERRFPDPDRFIIDRPDNRHLAFGSGPHFCIGSQVVRLEAELLLQRLFQRFPRMSVKDAQFSPVPDLSFPMLTRLVLSLR